MKNLLSASKKIALLAAVPLTALAGPPQLVLDVARFRNLNLVEKGAEIDIYVTVPTQPLTYRQRALRSFQAAASVTLEVLKPDGQPAWREVVTLKPPVLNDTTMAIKNPLSFLKRVLLPDGRYTLRGTVRDQYRSANGSTTVERPLVLETPTGPHLSDVLLLARPAAKTTGQTDFSRGGYLLTRAPGGLYGRGTEQLYFYAELSQAPAGQPLRVQYRLASGSAKPQEVSLTPAAGRPSAVLGQVPLADLPDGDFALLVDVYSGSKLLLSRRATGRRNNTDYAPAGAPAAR